jgi:hypothetical protein
MQEIFHAAKSPFCLPQSRLAVVDAAVGQAKQLDQHYIQVYVANAHLKSPLHLV